MTSSSELENAVNEVDAFNELLVAFIRHNTEGPGAESSRSKSEAETLSCGLMELQGNVMKRLREASGLQEERKAS